MSEFDTTALLDRIIEDAKIPRGSQYREDGKLLRMADDKTRTVVMPRLLEAGEGHLAVVQSFPLAANQSRVRLPPRAVRLLDVALLNAEGVPIHLFARATPLQEREARIRGFNLRAGAPTLWYLEGSTLVLSPKADAASRFTLSLRYARRPSRLVLPSMAGTITQRYTSGGNTRLVFTPNDVLGNVVEVVPVDIVKGTPGFESLADDVAGSVVSLGPALVYEIPGTTTEVEVGDYLCPPGTTPVPQIPADYHSILAQAVVVQYLKDSGNADGAAVAQNTLAELMLTAQSTIEARSTEPEVCIQDDWL